MNIILNGQSAELDRPLSLTEIVERFGYAGQPVAVAVNLECVPRTEHPRTYVRDGDRVEILSPQAGG